MNELIDLLKKSELFPQNIKIKMDQVDLNPKLNVYVEVLNDNTNINRRAWVLNRRYNLLWFFCWYFNIVDLFFVNTIDYCVDIGVKFFAEYIEKYEKSDSSFLSMRNYTSHFAIKEIINSSIIPTCENCVLNFKRISVFDFDNNVRKITLFRKSSNTSPQSLKALSACILLNHCVKIPIQYISTLTTITDLTICFINRDGKIRTTYFCNRILHEFISQNYNRFRNFIRPWFYPYCVCFTGLMNDEHIKTYHVREIQTNKYCIPCNALYFRTVEKTKTDVIKNNYFNCICDNSKR